MSKKKKFHRAILRTPWVATRRVLWKWVAQKGEFIFHKYHAWRPSSVFMEEASALFEYFGYSRNQFIGQVVLDVGAGSQLLTKFFEGVRIIAIEPLAEKFLSELDWCELKDADEVYSVPGEERIESLIGQVDFAVSVNVLDHCFDPAVVVKNMYDYLRVGGQACISVDCRSHRDLLHQRLLSEELLGQMVRNAGFVVEKILRGLETIYSDRRQSYGSGNTITFILVKQQSGILGEQT